MNNIYKQKRAKALGRLFIEAKKRQIAAGDLQDTIALNVINKRLSEANIIEIGRVIDHITGKKNKHKMYPASLAGLKQEIIDIAKARWGGSSAGSEWEGSLNAFCVKFGVMKWQWLNISHARAIKKRLKELQGKPTTPTPPCQGGE
jgi:hypothetical protein